MDQKQSEKKKPRLEIEATEKTEENWFQTRMCQVNTQIIKLLLFFSWESW